MMPAMFVLLMPSTLYRPSSFCLRFIRKLFVYSRKMQEKRPRTNMPRVMNMDTYIGPLDVPAASSFEPGSETMAAMM